MSELRILPGRARRVLSRRRRFPRTSRRRWRWACALGSGLLVLAAAVASPWSGQRSEEGFPLTFDRTWVDLGDAVTPGVEVSVRFLLTNPTEEPVKYFAKVSSRSVTAPWKTTELGPGESQEIEVLIEPKIAGPFRYRIGVVAGETRAAIFIEGWASE